MKLSELRGERAIEIIADLIAPIANIASDQKNLKLFRAERKEGESDRDAAARDLKEKIPQLLRTHKKDVLDILCAVNDVKPDELSLVDIIGGVIDLINDKDFMNLFLSAVSRGEPTQPTESSAEQTNSEPEY